MYLGTLLTLISSYSAAFASTDYFAAISPASVTNPAHRSAPARSPSPKHLRSFARILKSERPGCYRLLYLGVYQMSLLVPTPISTLKISCVRCTPKQGGSLSSGQTLTDMNQRFASTFQGWALTHPCSLLLATLEWHLVSSIVDADVEYELHERLQRACNALKVRYSEHVRAATKGTTLLLLGGCLVVGVLARVGP